MGLVGDKKGHSGSQMNISGHVPGPCRVSHVLEPAGPSLGLNDDGSQQKYDNVNTKPQDGEYEHQVLHGLILLG